MNLKQMFENGADKTRPVGANGYIKALDGEMDPGPHHEHSRKVPERGSRFSN
jgi:hypothetical protein